VVLYWCSPLLLLLLLLLLLPQLFCQVQQQHSVNSHSVQLSMPSLA
jgi:hypothetical protein